MTFDEALAKFKASEEVADVLVLLGDSAAALALRRVALAFPKISIVRNKSELKDGTDLWDRLWSSVDLDLLKLGSLSGTKQDADRYLDVLIGHRLIYPDGTLADSARKALRQLAKTKLGL